MDRRVGWTRWEKEGKRKERTTREHSRRENVFRQKGAQEERREGGGGGGGGGGAEAVDVWGRDIASVQEEEAGGGGRERASQARPSQVKRSAQKLDG